MHPGHKGAGGVIFCEVAWCARSDFRYWRSLVEPGAASHKRVLSALPDPVCSKADAAAAAALRQQLLLLLGIGTTQVPDLADATQLPFTRYIKSTAKLQVRIRV